MDQVLIHHKGLGVSVLIPTEAVAVWTGPGDGWTVVDHPERKRSAEFIPTNAPVSADAESEAKT